jgi:hypothetical protein
MKGFIVSIIAVMMFTVPAASQSRLGNFSQRGAASQEMRAEGFAAAHPSLPLNTKAKITNVRNGKEIEVVIINRIPVSPDRILDISQAALRALDMKAGETIVLSVSAPLPPERTTEQDEIVELADPALAVLSVIEGEKSGEKSGQEADNEREKKAGFLNNDKEQGNRVFSNNESDNSEKAAIASDLLPFPVNSDSNAEFLAWLMTMTMDAREAREAREIREIREAREARESQEIRLEREMQEIREARDKRETKTSPVPVNGLLPKVQGVPQIIPVLPGWNSGKRYRLQVGAYSLPDMAEKAVLLVKSAGFDVEREYSGSIYRVLAVDIASEDVYSAAVRLGSLGFSQVWVKE